MYNIFMYIRSLNVYKRVQQRPLFVINLRFENFKDLKLKALP